MKVIVYWKIAGFDKRHGEPIPLEVALAWVKKMNKKYGTGTHWINEMDFNGAKEPIGQ